MDIKNLVYVGTYTEPILFGTGQVLQGQGKGIHSFVFDPDAGTLTPHILTENVRNPSYLCLNSDRTFLYCVNEYKEFDGKPSGGVSAFRIDQTTGGLTWLNTKPSHGTDPCHLIIDPTGRYVLIANFASGSTCVLPIMADGSLGDEADWVQHQGASVHPVRQKGPHAHAVEFSARRPLRLCPRSRQRRGHHLRLRPGQRQADLCRPAEGEMQARRRTAATGDASRGRLRLSDQRTRLRR